MLCDVDSDVILLHLIVDTKSQVQLDRKDYRVHLLLGDLLRQQLEMGRNGCVRVGSVVRGRDAFPVQTEANSCDFSLGGKRRCDIQKYVLAIAGAIIAYCYYDKEELPEGGEKRGQMKMAYACQFILGDRNLKA